MQTHDDQRVATVTHALFANGGAMGKLLATIDWAQTPLGPVATWSPILRTSVRICLTSRHPILLWWGDDFIKIYNDAYAPILGQKHPWALGQPGRAVWPEIWDTIGPMLAGVHATGQATWSDDQLLLLERHGYPEECYFTFSYSPVEDETGAVCGIFTAVNETTERVLSARRARLTQDLTRSLADAHTTEEVATLATRTLAQSPADVPISLMYGVVADGHSLTLLAETGIAPDTATNPSTFTRNGALPWPIPEDGGIQTVTGCAWYRGDAALNPHTALVIPVIEPGRSVPTLVWVAGISPRRPADDAYRAWFDTLRGHLATALATAHAIAAERQRAEALAALDRAKTAFFSNVSHEFRTPLTLMLGPIADSLADEREPLPPEQRARQEVVQRNGRRLLKLVNTLLDFSRIEAGRMMASFVPTDLARYTADLASTFRSLIERAGMSLVIDCPPLPQPVYVDREMWEKIVLNLLSNAFKFTFTGEIAVRLHATATGVELRVSDTGTGIPAEDLPRIFERFHRVAGAQGRTYEGSGIGLALVHELVQLHGGTITAASTVGQGTTFTLTLPLGTAHLPSAQVRLGDTLDTLTAPVAEAFVDEAGRWLAPATGGVDAPMTGDDVPWGDAGPSPLSARIVLADDNADMRDYLSRLLAARYAVTAVANGAQALAAIRAQPPDLVLSDVMMPELDGYGLLRALRDDPHTADIPVILLSARAGEEATVEGLAAGADDYLVKPFAAREVLVRVATRLEVARARRAVAERARQLQAIFAAVADGLVIYDTEGRLVEWNAAFADLFELDHVSHITEGSLEQRMAKMQVRGADGQPVPYEAVPFMRALHGAVVAGNDAMELAITLPNGRHVVASVSAAPLRDAQGTIVGAIASYRDITERKQLEQRTQEALDALLAMATAVTQVSEEGSDAAISVLTHVINLAQRVIGGKYISFIVVDHATGRVRPLTVTGLSPEDEARWWDAVTGAQLEDFVTKEQANALRDGEDLLFSQVSESPPVADQYYWGIQTNLVVPVAFAGHLLVLTVEVRGRDAFTPQERALAHAAAHLGAKVLERDDLLRTQLDARAREAALNETNRQMNEFLGIASHELRTPLTSIMANVQMSERRIRELAASTQEAMMQRRVVQMQDLLGRTSGQLRRLDRLVGDLLDVSRISAGKLELRAERGDLLALVRGSVEEQQMAWADRVITLALPKRETLPVVMDADRIGQVLTNFLTNALKYAPPDQPIDVSVRATWAEVHVRVRDHGPGLTSAQMEHIFDRFYRVPGIMQQSGSGIGLGLGLYICRTIITRHGGAIGVKSTPGDGSTFWFTLPRGGAGDGNAHPAPKQ